MTRQILHYVGTGLLGALALLSLPLLSLKNEANAQIIYRPVGPEFDGSNLYYMILARSLIGHTHDAGSAFTSGTINVSFYDAYSNLVWRGDVGTNAGQLAHGDHTHNLEDMGGTLDPTRYRAYDSLDEWADIGDGSNQVAAGDHIHAGYESTMGTLAANIGTVSNMVTLEQNRAMLAEAGIETFLLAHIGTNSSEHAAFSNLIMNLQVRTSTWDTVTDKVDTSIYTNEVAIIHGRIDTNSSHIAQLWYWTGQLSNRVDAIEDQTNTWNQAATDATYSTNQIAGILAWPTGDWSTAYVWGNHASNDYATGTPVYVESDPVWGGVSNTIVEQAGQGATAYGWGDHGTNGYLTDEAYVGTITGVTITAGSSDSVVVTGPNAVITWNTNAAGGGASNDLSAWSTYPANGGINFYNAPINVFTCYFGDAQQYESTDGSEPWGCYPPASTISNILHVGNFDEYIYDTLNAGDTQHWVEVSTITNIDDIPRNIFITGIEGVASVSYGLGETAYYKFGILKNGNWYGTDYETIVYGSSETAISNLVFGSADDLYGSAMTVNDLISDDFAARMHLKYKAFGGLYLNNFRLLVYYKNGDDAAKTYSGNMTAGENGLYINTNLTLTGGNLNMGAQSITNATNVSAHSMTMTGGNLDGGGGVITNVSYAAFISATPLRLGSSGTFNQLYAVGGSDMWAVRVVSPGNDMEIRRVLPVANSIIVFGTNRNVSITGGDLSVFGTLSKGGGSFLIDHPLDPLNKNLVHSFVEAPRMELIYRDFVTLEKGKGQISIDATYGMMPGTFEALTRNPQVMVWNNETWDKVRGTITGDVVYVEAEKSIDARIEWMVIAQRDDPFVYNTDMCDTNGNVILEPVKPDAPAGLLDAETREGDLAETLQEPVSVGAKGYKGYPMRPVHYGIAKPKKTINVIKRKDDK